MAISDVPAFAHLTDADIESLAQRLAPQVAAAVGATFTVAVIACASQIGSGALPLETVPSAGLAIRPTVKRGAGRSVGRLASLLRQLPIPVLGRLEDQALVLDLRGLDDEMGFLANLAHLRQDRNADALA